jgi:Ca2+-binding EF-hand superfamily protein
MQAIPCRMPRSRIPAALALAAGLAAVPCALAGGLTDYDGDGRVSLTEYRTAVAEIAERADVDKNGVIDASEFTFTAADLALFDNNADVKVTAVGVQEFIDGMDVAFEAMDADMDGYLNAAELGAAKGRYGISAQALPGGQAASGNPRPFSRG